MVWVYFQLGSLKDSFLLQIYFAYLGLALGGGGLGGDALGGGGLGG